MQEELMNKEEIDLEQLIVGALLKFERIDNVDMRMLIDDFEKIRRENYILILE